MSARVYAVGLVFAWLLGYWTRGERRRQTTMLLRTGRRQFLAVDSRGGVHVSAAGIGEGPVWKWTGADWREVEP